MIFLILICDLLFIKGLLKIFLGWVTLLGNSNPMFSSILDTLGFLKG